MKQIIPILILILISSCQENKTKESETLKVESKIETIEQVKQETEKRLTTDTLQYLEEGENEDNLYAVFLTKELETITIVLSENEDLENMEKNTMWLCEWENRVMTSGGDEEVKYNQAFMKTIKLIETTRFKN